MDGSSKDSRSQRDKRRVDRQHSSHRGGRGGGGGGRRGGRAAPPQHHHHDEEEEEGTSAAASVSLEEDAFGGDLLELVAAAKARSGASQVRLASEAAWYDAAAAAAATATTPKATALGEALAKLSLAKRLLLSGTEDAAADHLLLHLLDETAAAAEPKPPEAKPVTAPALQDREVEDELDELLRL